MIGFDSYEDGKKQHNLKGEANTNNEFGAVEEDVRAVQASAIDDGEGEGRWEDGDDDEEYDEE